MRGSLDWKRIAKVLVDKQGLPKISELMGARFWPVVVAFSYGWQHISLDNTRVEQTNRPSSRFEFVPPPRSKWED
ncbi:heterodisulfide reductase subunit B [Bradyrhizobium sp. LA7.1]